MNTYMNPFQKYLKRLFSRQRVIGDDLALKGLAKADAILNNLVNEKKVPGLSITVLKDGKTFFLKGYGYSDLENTIPVDPTKTIFRIASVSKPIAATALAHMVADGLIDLDASFYKYVPYYPKKKWDFTIRQLASHTAGIRGYQGVEYGLNHPYTIKGGIDIFKDDDLMFEPGRGYLYNSFDWVLVSLAMQEVSGIQFEEYVQQKVLDPLGMVNTFAECDLDQITEEGRGGELNTDSTWETKTSAGFRQSGTRSDKAKIDKPKINKPIIYGTGQEQASNITHLTGHVSKFYSKNRKGFRPAIPVNNFYKLAGGGYLSTSPEIAKFGQAYLDGAILSEEIRSQFLTSQSINGNPTYYGLGWQVSEDAKGRPFYGHIGNGVGGYSNFFVYPEERMVFSVLINCTDPKVQEELDEVVDTLLPTPNY